MRLVATVKLVVTPEQAQALQETLETANACCEWLSERAWDTRTFGQYKLHRLAYAEARERFGLSAQVVVRCIAKVADAYKLDRRTQRHFRPHGSIAYDDRILRWQVSRSQVSIWTTRGRLTLPYVCGERQRELLQTQQGESDLSFREGRWYLSATCNVETPEPIDVEGTLGVDLGIVEIATDSEGHSYSGEQVRSVRRRLKRIRALLQSRGTKSAKRHLQKIARKQSRFVRHTNHVVSKQLVQAAVDSRKALALEDLKGIRERGNGFSREMRWLLGNWAFDQLRQFVSYKAERAGIPVILVDARDTSRTCSACGYCDKANRKTQALFSCLQCGFEINADINAALNLEARAEVTRPNVWAAS